MKKHGAITFWLMLLAVTTGCFQASTAFCQGTAFTYQGVLASSGGPATGFYDLEFSVFDAVTNGNLIAGPLTNTATPVNNGLFIVTLDFGSVFNGSNCWLQIGVRTNGAGAFTTLNPLQPLAPTPYAIYAANAGSAGALTGVLAGGGLSGAYSNAVALTNTANQLAGSFAGNGSGLTNLQAANLSGIVPPSSLGLDANSFTTNSSGQIIATNADLSVNLGTLPNLEKALRSNSPPSFLWFGDSTGAYLLASLQTWLQNYSSDHAVQLTSFCSAACPWWVSNSSPPAAFSDSRYYWYPYIMGAIGPGTNSIWGAGGGPLAYAIGNQINVCMCASVTNGSAGIYTNTGNGWGFLGLLNQATLGKEGQLFITNFAVPLAGYQVKISGLSGNFPILGVGCIQTNCNIPIFYDMHAPGINLQGWTNMGQSIGVILSNINPALVVEEQVKPISTYNDYTNFAWWMSNDAPNADVVLISSYADSTDGDGDVADYTYNLSLYERNVAITNHWPFVDVWTPMGSWSNIVANGFNLDTVVHLNARGQDFLSQIVIQKLNLPAIWQAAGLASVPTTFTGNLDVIGDLTITPTDFPSGPVQFGAEANNLSVMTFNSGEPSWNTTGYWSLGAYSSGSAYQTLLHGLSGIAFSTVNNDPLGTLWPDGGWSFLDADYDPHGSVDPGGPGVILANTTTNYNLSFAGNGFASGATSVTTNITAATWVNTNQVNGSIWVSAATNLTFFNRAGILVFGPVSVTNAAFPVGTGWTVTNSAATFNFGAF